MTTTPLADFSGVTWVVSDGRAGNERPCLALAAALGIEPIVLRSTLEGFRGSLSPLVLPGGLRSIGGDEIGPPWPDLLISAGRAGAGLSRMIGRVAGSGCFRVQILSPRIDPAHWGVVIAPRHDELSGPNVISTVGSLHDVTDATLARDREHFDDRLSALPGPRIAVLLGGPHRAFPDWRQRALDLLSWAVSQCEAGNAASLMISGSRRTPALAIEAAERAISQVGHGELYAGDGTNPYGGYLAWADVIAVTPDSINMVSEALGVGVPVVSDGSGAQRQNFALFHDHLQAIGLVNLPTAGRYEAPEAPLRETSEVAQKVAAMFLKSRKDAIDRV